MSSTSTRTDRTDRSISDRLQAALPRPAERPFDRCGVTASVASYTNMCRSHDVTGFSAPTALAVLGVNIAVLVLPGTLPLAAQRRLAARRAG
jgi:hypothetical protein